MERPKKSGEKVTSMAPEDEVRFLPTEEMLQQAEIILEQYAESFEKLANS